MGKPTSKKGTSGAKNPDRRNGKAWKKPQAPKPGKTEARMQRDLEIREAREEKRLLGMAAHAVRLAEAAEKARVAAEERAEIRAAQDRNRQRQSELARESLLEQEDHAAVQEHFVKAMMIYAA